MSQQSAREELDKAIQVLLLAFQHTDQDLLTTWDYELLKYINYHQAVQQTIERIITNG